MCILLAGRQNLLPDGILFLGIATAAVIKDLAKVLKVPFPEVVWNHQTHPNMLHVRGMHRVVLDGDDPTITLDWIGGDLSTWQAFVFGFRQYSTWRTFNQTQRVV